MCPLKYFGVVSDAGGSHGGFVILMEMVFAKGEDAVSHDEAEYL